MAKKGTEKKKVTEAEEAPPPIEEETPTLPPTDPPMSLQEFGKREGVASGIQAGMRLIFGESYRILEDWRDLRAKFEQKPTSKSWFEWDAEWEAKKPI